MKIIKTEIIDNEESDHNGDYNIAGISVLVTLEYNNKNYTLDYQTSTTHDYGAMSSDLGAYDDDADYPALFDDFNSSRNTEDIHSDNYYHEAEKWEDFSDFLNEIKELADVNEIWTNYVEENYIRENPAGNFFDANSEFVHAKSKEE